MLWPWVCYTHRPQLPHLQNEDITFIAMDVLWIKLSSVHQLFYIWWHTKILLTPLWSVGGVKEKNHRFKMASLVLKSMTPNLDLISNLIAVSAFHQKCNLNQPVWNFLVSTNEVICHLGLLQASEEEEAICMINPLQFPSPHERGHHVPKIILFFLLLIAPLPHPSSYKNFILYNPSESPSSC